MEKPSYSLAIFNVESVSEGGVGLVFKWFEKDHFKHRKNKTLFFPRRTFSFATPKAGVNGVDKFPILFIPNGTKALLPGESYAALTSAISKSHRPFIAAICDKDLFNIVYKGLNTTTFSETVTVIAPEEVYLVTIRGGSQKEGTVREIVSHFILLTAKDPIPLLRTGNWKIKTKQGHRQLMIPPPLPKPTADQLALANIK